MNEHDVVEKVAVFIEKQCPRRILGLKCDEHSCSVHRMAAQVRNRQFEDQTVTVQHKEELDKAEEEFMRRHSAVTKESN